MPYKEEGLAAYPVPLPENPFTNPDLREKSTLGFQPDPMAQTVRGLPTRLMQNADESLTKNIVAYMPKPKESRYGSIRMPRASDDPMNAGAFVMAGPIAVEEVLGRFAAKALPAKSLENKLLQMGASKAELETRGVTKYLESQGTRPVHPLEVMKHLDDNPYQLNEVVKSSRREARQVFQLKYPDGTHVGAPFDTEKEAIAAMNDLRNPKAALGRGQQEPLSITETLSERPLNPPKFEQWQTPGGENYREILLQAPKSPVDLASPRLKEIQQRGEEVEEELRSALTRWREVGIGDLRVNQKFNNIIEPLRAEKDKLAAEGEKLVPNPFTGGHWQEPNVVAHMRVNDRKLPSGERALHVEEWQSDWSNASRSHKIGGEFQVLVGREEVGDFPTKQAAEEFVRKHTEQTIKVGGTPQNYNIKEKNKPNPLVDNWQDLMARRTLKEAVDGGYDRLTWTTGQQQADRYDLSKHISQLSVARRPDGYVVWMVDKDSELVGSELGEFVAAQDLERTIGKDLAKKAVTKLEDMPIVGADKTTEPVDFDGLDLKVGGEWATKLYDESMVNRFNKIGKRYGVKVDEVDLTKSVRRAHELKYAGEGGPAPKEVKAHSIKITPEMKESIGGSKFHPFADLPGPKPKVAPTPPPTPAAAKKVDLHAEAAALDPGNPVRYIGNQGDYPMMQQDDPGVGSFIVRPGETVAGAFERAKSRYQK